MPDPTEEAGSRGEGAGSEAAGKGVREEGTRGEGGHPDSPCLPLVPHSLTPSLPAPTPTPGEIAYGMYQRRVHNLEEHIPLDYPRPFRFLSAAQRAAWEAAAQAVLAWRAQEEARDA